MQLSHRGTIKMVVRTKSYKACPLKIFFEQILQRRGKKTAVVSLARKLRTIAYNEPRTQTMHDPKGLTPEVV